jgi:hypothetical protein
MDYISRHMHGTNGWIIIHSNTTFNLQKFMSTSSFVIPTNFQSLWFMLMTPLSLVISWCLFKT